ncbi:MAG: hypothetical protein JJT77_06975 [Crocinitomicaceae bacterium]|nr:hypothetical protein [Crocinitomicaceae bacterium]
MKKRLVQLMIITCIGLLSPLNILRAQNNDFEPSFSFRAEVGLPAALEVSTNKGFRDLLTGIVNVSPFVQYTMENKFTVGGGLKYTMFNVNEFRNNFDLSGNIHMFSGFIKIGREEFFGKLGVDYGVKFGYGINLFDTNFCREELGRANESYDFMIEPGVSLIYMVNENSAFYIGQLAYAVHSFNFTPDKVCVTNFPGIGPDQLRNRTSYLTFGFGYSYYF